MSAPTMSDWTHFLTEIKIGIQHSVSTKRKFDSKRYFQHERLLILGRFYINKAGSEIKRKRLQNYKDELKKNTKYPTVKPYRKEPFEIDNLKWNIISAIFFFAHKSKAVLIEIFVVNRSASVYCFNEKYLYTIVILNSVVNELQIKQHYS